MYPFIFPHSDFIRIPTYVLIISLVYCFSPFWILRRAEQKDLSKTLSLDLCLAIMIGGLFGARFMHVYYEMPEFYRLNPAEILKIWEGGFVFYGGFFGALLCALALLRYRKESFLTWADLFAPVLAMAYATGRIGCFLAGCCYGRACDLPWAVHFPPGGEAPSGYLHPTQLYAASWEFALVILLLYFERHLNKLSYTFNGDRMSLTKPGSLFFIWLFLHGVGRIVMEMFRDDPRGPDFLGLSISTWISACLMLVSIGFILSKRKNNVSGAV